MAGLPICFSHPGRAVAVFGGAERAGAAPGEAQGAAALGLEAGPGQAGLALTLRKLCPAGPQLRGDTEPAGGIKRRAGRTPALKTAGCVDTVSASAGLGSQARTLIVILALKNKQRYN